MKHITLIANDKDGNELGKQENFPIAETLDDILAMVNEDNGWNEEEIVSCFNAGSRVKRQTQLRGSKPENENVKAFKKLTPEQQAALLAK
jgi:hypothetical protein